MVNSIQQAYEAYINLLYELLLSNCPVDTGNMKTHIKMENDGKQCVFTIETIPYTEARRKKSHIKNKADEKEYAPYTEYHNKSSKGWIREDSIKEAALQIANEVDYRL
jgi:hypothetical protein